MKILFSNFFLVFLILTGCFFQPDDVKTSGLNPALRSKVHGHSQITSVSIINDQLLINGIKLENVTKVKIAGPSGFNESFSIESKTASKIVANGMKSAARRNLWAFGRTSDHETPQAA